MSCTYGKSPPAHSQLAAPLFASYGPLCCLLVAACQDLHGTSEVSIPAADLKNWSFPDPYPTTVVLSVKLLEFNISDLALWLLHPELTISLRRVRSNETKFWYMMFALDAETGAHASSVITPVEAGSKYTVLRDFLLTVGLCKVGSCRQ